MYSMVLMMALAGAEVTPDVHFLRGRAVGSCVGDRAGTVALAGCGGSFLGIRERVHERREARQSRRTTRYGSCSGVSVQQPAAVYMAPSAPAVQAPKVIYKKMPVGPKESGWYPTPGDEKRAPALAKKVGTNQAAVTAELIQYPKQYVECINGQCRTIKTTAYSNQHNSWPPEGAIVIYNRR